MLSIDNPNSVDFPVLDNSNFGINPINLNAGFFKLSWLQTNISPISVTDGVRMFSFTLISIAEGSSVVQIDPVQIQEIMDQNFNEIGLLAENTNIEVMNAGVASITSVPTMTQWGLFLFSLVMLNLGLTFVYQQHYKKQLIEQNIG